MTAPDLDALAERDPFHIDGPTSISFSGGRTSAYMLWRVLQSNGGALPAECVCCFANTGKEEEATLRFVRDCATNWGVPIVWIEYLADAPGYAVVDFDTASRNGEPFEAIIRKRNYLPNPVTRFCTTELKIRPMGKYVRSLFGGDDIDMLLGIRADEPRRASKIRNGKNSESVRISNLIPLADAGVTLLDVDEFWQQQPFRLELPTINGRTLHGNCDLCFLKSANQVRTLIAEKPARAVWWVRMEALALASKPFGAVFRSDRPSYAAMLKNAAGQIDAFGYDDDAIACYCGE